MTDQSETSKIVLIKLDQQDAPRLSPEAEHERSIAIYDLIEANSFEVPEKEGPYHVILRADLRHIHFDMLLKTFLGRFLSGHGAASSFRDYRMVCESYYDAIRTKLHLKFRRLIWDGVHYITGASNFMERSGKVDDENLAPL